MAKPIKEKVIKQPTLFLALVPIITMVLLLSLGYVLFELPPEPLIIASTIVAGIIAIKLGYSYDDIMGSICSKNRQDDAGHSDIDHRRLYDRCLDGRGHDSNDDFLWT